MKFIKSGRWRSTLAVLASLLFMFGIQAVAADSFREGVVAYRDGDFKRAHDSWLPLAEQGNVLAQTLLGSLYTYGQGVDRDDVVAASWFRRAAEAGSSQAQFNLAILYENGWGVDKDLEQARHWYRAAAEQGREDAASRYAALAEASAPVASTEPANTDTKSTANIARLMPYIPIAQDQLADDAPAPAEPTQDNLAWLSMQPGNHYTLQLAASTDLTLLRDSFDKLKFDSTHYAFVESRRSGVPWYALIYGSYPSLSQAMQAMQSLPPAMGIYRPWIRPFIDIKSWRDHAGTVAGATPGDTGQ